VVYSAYKNPGMEGDENYEIGKSGIRTRKADKK